NVFEFNGSYAEYSFTGTDAIIELYGFIGNEDYIIRYNISDENNITLYDGMNDSGPINASDLMELNFTPELIVLNGQNINGTSGIIGSVNIGFYPDNSRNYTVEMFLEDNETEYSEIIGSVGDFSVFEEEEDDNRTPISFLGYAYDSVGTPLENVNISLKRQEAECTNESYESNPEEHEDDCNITIVTESILSAANGSFNLTFSPQSNNSAYDITLIKYNSSNPLVADYINEPFDGLLHYEINSISDFKFYLKEAVSINLSINKTDGYSDNNFTYRIYDKTNGKEIEEYWEGAGLESFIIHLPKERDYAVMMQANGQYIQLNKNWLSANFNSGMNQYNYSLNNINNNITVTVNETSLSHLECTALIVSPGNIISSNMYSNWEPDTSRYNEINDSVDLINGKYNLSISNSGEGVELLMTCYAENGSDRFLGYKNLTLTLGNNNYNVNMNLLPAAGDHMVCKRNTEGDRCFNVSTSYIGVNLPNGTRISNITGGDFSLVAELDLTDSTDQHYNWIMEDCSLINKYLPLPLINGQEITFTVFSSEQNSAPLEKTVIVSGDVNLTLSEWDADAIEDNQTSEPFVDIIVSNATCNVPNYDVSCSVLGGKVSLNMSDSDLQNEMTKILIGGQNLTFVLGDFNTNVTIMYLGTDLLASGPTNALFDVEPEDVGGDDLWRFGSVGPKIYENVIVSMPLSPDLQGSENISVELGNLYGDEFNSSEWTDGDELPEDYQDFGQEYFEGNNSKIIPCLSNDSNMSGICYLDNQTDFVWMKVPHFSGVGPKISGESGDSENATINKTTFNSPVAVGETARFKINVTNTGTVNLTNVEIKDSWNSTYLNYTNWSSSDNFTFDHVDYTQNEVFWNLTLTTGNSAILHVNFSTLSVGDARNEANIENSTGGALDSDYTYFIISSNETVPINVALIYPPDNSTMNTSTFYLNYTVNIQSNCTLHVWNSSDAEIDNGTATGSGSIGFVVNNTENGNYSWNAYCVDAGNSSNEGWGNETHNWTFTINATSPPINVTLNYPTDNLTINTSTFNLNYAVNMQANCTIYSNTSGGSWNAIVNNEHSGEWSLEISPENGNYIWNVYCFDINDENNSAWGNETQNWTFTVNASGGGEAVSVQVNKHDMTSPPYEINSTIQFIITITNDGSENLTEINLTDNFNASCINYNWSSIQPNGTPPGQVNWFDVNNGTPLASGQNITIYVNFTAINECMNTSNVAIVNATNGTTLVSHQWEIDFSVGGEGGGPGEDWEMGLNEWQSKIVSPYIIKNQWKLINFSIYREAGEQSCLNNLTIILPNSNFTFNGYNDTT
ncbi:MAG: DUF11 domain-containing protein, partial [Candidatus Aenigmarchaeota archaeon]|nr:DUF11 domain-containing protein [Candidatus Aenigmarchaeota archaeon]